MKKILITFAVSMLLGATAFALPHRAQAAPNTVAVGNNWFGNAGSTGTVFVTSINAGDTIQWVWESGAGVHNITESDAMFTPNGGSNVGASAVAVHAYGPVTFNSAGTFYYLCTLHETAMKGQINVAELPASPTATGTVDSTATTTPTATDTEVATNTPTSTATSTPTVAVISAPNTGSGDGGGVDASKVFMVGIVAMLIGIGVLALAGLILRDAQEIDAEDNFI